MSLANEIRKYIDENEISQRVLSRKASISENALNLALNNKRKLSADEYIRICDALCVPYHRFARTSEEQAS